MMRTSESGRTSTGRPCATASGHDRDAGPIIAALAVLTAGPPTAVLTRQRAVAERASGDKLRRFMEALPYLLTLARPPPNDPDS
jgi:hypothetical protein